MSQSRVSRQLREYAYLGLGLTLLPLLLLSTESENGAYFSVGTIAHWVFAFFSSVVFLSLLLVMFNGGFALVKALVLRGVFVGTIGVFLLLGFQWVAEYSLQLRITHGDAVSSIVFYVVQFIGFSYRCTCDPSAGPFLTFIGYTAAVGLCEEVCKALPILRDSENGDACDLGRLGWRGACLSGLACGVGFGVAEGIHYAQNYYNGVFGLEIYFIRFVSCVGLHALWTGSAAICIYLTDDATSNWWTLFRALALPILGHGLYDTFLTVGYPYWANLTAIASFVLFVGLVEFARTKDDQGVTSWLRRPVASVSLQKPKVKAAAFNQKEVDSILDKIAANGIESLTLSERNVLDVARRELEKR